MNINILFGIGIGIIVFCISMIIVAFILALLFSSVLHLMRKFGITFTFINYGD